MDIFSLAVDTKGAIVPYLDSMNILVQSGTRCVAYATADMQGHIANFQGEVLLDDYNLDEFVHAHRVFDSATNTIKLFRASQHILSAWTPHIMRRIQKAIDEKQLNPENTLIVFNTVGLMYLGHFLLEQGFKSFYILEPYRLVDWMREWTNSDSQFIPKFVPERQFIQFVWGRQGKNLTEAFFQRGTDYRFKDIQSAIHRHTLMYSPQLSANGEHALGYPYPNTSGILDEELELFIQEAHKQEQLVLIFTLGSMDISSEEKARIIDGFIAGVEQMGHAAIILGSDTPENAPVNVLFVNRFVRYDLLFPLADVIVEHCGAGSTHLALWAGKPVLAIPFLRDQYDWAKRLDKLDMLIGIVPKEKFNKSSFIKVFQQGYSQAVIEAAQQAGEQERTHYAQGREQIAIEVQNAIHALSE